MRPTTTVRLSDGRAIYVEPMAFARSNLSYALAGAPLYMWKARDAAAAPQLDSSETLFGAVFDRSGRATALSKPPVQGSVTNVRLVEDGDGYAAVFAETRPPARGGREPALLAYWFARMTGNTWRSLVRLPLPPAGGLITREASQLVRVGSALMIAVPFESGVRQDVAVYARTTEGWTLDTIPARGTAYVALTARAAQPFLYVVRPDSTRLTDANSLSLFVRSSGSWRHHGFIVHGGQRPIHHPTVAQSDSPTLSWLENDEVAGIRSARAARIRSDGTLGPTVTLGRNVGDAVLVHGSTGSTRWVLETQAAGQPVLALVEWDDGEPMVRDAVVNPFTGSALAYSTEAGDVVVGPVMGRSSREELVVSGVLRFTARCRSSTSSGTP